MGSTIIANQIKGLTDENIVQIPTGIAGKYMQELFDGSYSLTLKVADIIARGPWVDARIGGEGYNRAAISAAMATIPMSGGTLYIAPGIWLIDSNLSIPDYISLKIEAGAKFNIGAGITLTINGFIDAGAWEIFTGDGTVSYSTTVNSVIYGAWEGGSGITFKETVYFDELPYGPSGQYPIESSQLANKLYVDLQTGSALMGAFAKIDETSPYGTNAAGAGAPWYGESVPDRTWNVRKLNTIVTDPEGIIIALSSNKFTLNSGRYLVWGQASYTRGRGACRIWDVTHGAMVVDGVNDGGSSDHGAHCQCVGYINVTSNGTEFRLEHFFDRTEGNNDNLGRAISAPGRDEIHASVSIFKIA